MMKPESIEESQSRYLREIVMLTRAGFTPLGNWRFSKDGLIYDMSAANLDQLERIEREGLFVEVE